MDAFAGALSLGKLMHDWLRARQAKRRTEDLFCVFEIFGVAASAKQDGKRTRIGGDVLLDDVVEDGDSAGELAVGHAGLDQVCVHVDVGAELVLA